MTTLRELERQVSYSYPKIRGNDMAFFCKQLKDDRLQVAFLLGWYLEREEYNGKKSYCLTAPPHYPCSKNNWAAYYKTVIIDGVSIVIPEYFYDDEVLLSGTRKDTLMIGTVIMLK